MKEFDFVKLTIWLAGVLTLALGIAFFVFGSKTRKIEGEIDAIRNLCGKVGLIAKDIKVLEQEKANDKAPQDNADKAGILSYFSAQAQHSRINPSQDYLFKPRDGEPNRKGGWIDTPFNIDFKKTNPTPREHLMKFLFNCETQSRRIKLQKARLTLADENAAADLWNADSLTFVRRDPAKSGTANN